MAGRRPGRGGRPAGRGRAGRANASPYERNKDDVRLALVPAPRPRGRAALAYVNLVGGQDELVFDGDSMVVVRVRRLGLLRAARNSPRAAGHVDLELPGPVRAARRAPGGRRGQQRDHRADRLAVAARRRSRTSRSRPTMRPAARRDAEVYWRAGPRGPRLRPPRTASRQSSWACPAASTRRWSPPSPPTPSAPTGCTRCSMPSRATPPNTRSSRRRGTGRPAGHRTPAIVPIAPMVERLRDGASSCTGLAEENLQARVRGTHLMGTVQRRRPSGPGHRQQERARGRLLHPLRRLGRAASRRSRTSQDAGLGAGPLAQPARLGEPAARSPPIPADSITSRQSAELRPGQLDTDSLPEYEVLDRLLRRLRREGHGLGRARRRRTRLRAGRPGHPARRPGRVQATPVSPGPEDQPKAFGRDRRLPITNRWREPRLG